MTIHTEIQRKLAFSYKVNMQYGCRFDILCHLTGKLPFPCAEDGTTFEDQARAPSESQVTHYREIR